MRWFETSNYAWSTPNGQGRLKQITAGTIANPTSLLDLRYYTGTNTPAYDAVGNITNIYDYKTGSPQTQTFTYDDLNRLLSAQATSGTDGNYSESYTYDASTGNLASKTGLGTYTYGDSSHAHAVTATQNGNSYQYDANGNQKTRVIGSSTYNLSYDAENRLVSVSGAVTASFTFDGDGSRVKSTIGSTTTTFVGSIYEITGSAVTKYYYSGVTRVAMRTSSGVRYLFGDHLGSASVTADNSGANVTRQLYKAWGETRSSGSVPTKYQYTGQFAYNGQNEIGLVFYVARFYDPALGRFTSPDTLIPEGTQGVQAWNRFAGMNNNPVMWNDPSGHCIGPLVFVCVGVALVIGAILLTGDTPQEITRPATADSNASNIGDLLQLGIEQADHANITGEGLQSLQNDPSVQAAEGRIVDKIRTEPGYGQQSFSLPGNFGKENFTANGGSGIWWKGALERNQAFYMIHTGSLYATNTKVSTDGTIVTTWKIEDQFEYLPAWEDTFRQGANYWAYNGYAQIVAPIYHGLFRAKPFPTNAYWDETIPPVEK